MKTSESVAKISPALLKAQQSITFAAKDANNPFFKSRYADLPTVIDAIKPALNDNGIVYLQSGSPNEVGMLALTTRLQHESGEWIEDTAIMPLAKADPQGWGSAMTYARRYNLAAMTGLYQDDDDGNAATGHAAPHAAAVSMPKPTPPQPPATPNENQLAQQAQAPFGGGRGLSVKQQGYLFSFAKKKGWEEADVKAYSAKFYNKPNPINLTSAELDMVLKQLKTLPDASPAQ